MGTILPFDTKAEKQLNLQAIAKSINPQIFGVSQQIVNQVESAVPQAQKALQYKGSIYEGVPNNFAVNRLYIAAQRHRESSIYALA